MALVLTVDTGGSKTAVQVHDTANDAVLSHTVVESGFGSPAESPEILPALKELLEEVASSYPPEAVAVNLGGRNKGQIAATLRAAFPSLPLAVCRESEGDAACAFGESVGAQIILLCGTGTIGIGMSPDGKRSVCGGWGMNISDFGSGYEIGLNAVRHSLLSLDGLAPLSLLARSITGREEPFGAVEELAVLCEQRDEVRRRFFPPERSRIAAYTRLAAQCAEQGDPAALDIFAEAGEQLAELALTTAAKAGAGPGCAFALTGGLIHTADLWRESFEERVLAALPGCRFTYRADGLLEGLYRIAKRLVSHKEMEV